MPAVDHFIEAERLLNETVREDASLPFVRHKLTRAGIHAQLAHVQALRAQTYDIDNEYTYNGSIGAEYTPVTTIDVKGGVL